MKKEKVVEKKSYMEPELTAIAFNAGDVIQTSGKSWELPIAPG